MHRYSRNYYDTSVSINSFYKNIHDLKISEISSKRIEDFKEKSKDLNKEYNNNYSDRPKNVRYSRIMDKIKTTPKTYDLNNSTEKLLFFMFSVDPEFEAVLIYEEANDTIQLKKKMESYFGVYDKNLIKIERWYIKNLLDKESRINLEEEAERRVYK